MLSPKPLPPPGIQQHEGVLCRPLARTRNHSRCWRFIGDRTARNRRSHVMRRPFSARILLSAALLFCLAARAQDYPSRPVKIIVPIASGASFDTATRLFAEKFREKWGQPVIVENRAGAGHNIGAKAASRAAPDGYTLLFAPPPSLVINKSLFAKLAYDPDAFA